MPLASAYLHTAEPVGSSLAGFSSVGIFDRWNKPMNPLPPTTSSLCAVADMTEEIEVLDASVTLGCGQLACLNVMTFNVPGIFAAFQVLLHPRLIVPSIVIGGETSF